MCFLRVLHGLRRAQKTFQASTKEQVTVTDRDRRERLVCLRQQSAAGHYRVARQAASGGRLRLAVTVQRYAAQRSANARALAEALR